MDINVAIIADECSTKTHQTLIRKLNRFLAHIISRNVEEPLRSRCVLCITSDRMDIEMEKSQYTEIEAGPRTMLNVFWKDLATIDEEVDAVIFGGISDERLRPYTTIIPALTPTITWPFHNIIGDSCVEHFSIALIHRHKFRWIFEDRNIPEIPKALIKSMCFNEDGSRTNALILKYWTDDVIDGVLTLDKLRFETNRFLRLLRATISDIHREPDQFTALADYGVVLRYGVRYRLDYRYARKDLGIDKLIAKYHL